RRKKIGANNKLNAAHYGSQHNNRFRICYAELTLNRKRILPFLDRFFKKRHFYKLKLTFIKYLNNVRSAMIHFSEKT
ncbi:hypothetical protein, partial [Leptospira noguchii]|uniref:hypothetical protein n=1 Tax=Leptospira noguchii TaxID=28182 RepID=UPI0009E2B715